MTHGVETKAGGGNGWFDYCEALNVGSVILIDLTLRR